jgi:iron-sulfur cluster assembly protein
MFKVTIKAIEKLDSLHTPNHDLKISIVGGGCSGLTYKMEWIPDSTLDESNLHFSGYDWVIKIDKKSSLFLDETTLDFEDGLNGRGFVWLNSKSKRTCGCGSSFNV